MLRRTALLCLAVCAPADSTERCPGGPAESCATAPVLAVHTNPDGSPVPPDSSATSAPAATVPSKSPTAPASPVPSDSPASTASPVPSASHVIAPPRLLARPVYEFHALADGDLLVTAPSPDHDGEHPLQRLDPDTGALTPWPLTWRPELEGWKLARGTTASHYTSRVSPDGRWIALQIGFAPRPQPGRPELDAVVLARADGSDPRCVGVGVPDDDLPELGWTADSSRLVGDWSVECSPDARGRARALPGLGHIDEHPRPRRWLDVATGERGVQPVDGADYHDHRDPHGDLECAQVVPGDGREWTWFFYDFASGARLGAVPWSGGLSEGFVGWVAADALLVDVPDRHARTGQRLLFTDGRSVDAPGVGWHIYARLPNGEQLFSRDDGRTVEQGVVDWSRFTVERSRPRPDLVRFDLHDSSTVTARPGLGGLLILQGATGELYLAGL